jgi:GNAT superfamily N-acetyltransferase
MKVRIARTDDLSELVTLRCSMWPHTTSIEHQQILLRRFASAARFATMVLVNDERLLCGFVEVMRDMGLPGESNSVSLQALFVSPPMRRGGGATALLGAAQRWAHARGAIRMSCDLSLDEHEAREKLLLLGFVEKQQWVRSTLAIKAPLEIPLRGGSEPLLGGLPGVPQDAPSVNQAFSGDTSEPLVVVVEKVRSPFYLVVNIFLFVVALAALANTNIYAKDMFRGMLLPLLDVALLLYFLLLFVTMRYRKRADPSARADQLFRIDE